MSEYWQDRAEDSTAECDYKNADEAWAHVAGARWQREALLSDEAVERAARGMFAWDTEEHPFPRPTWEGLSEAQRDVWRSGARATLAAATGEGENDE